MVAAVSAVLTALGSPFPTEKPELVADVTGGRGLRKGEEPGVYGGGLVGVHGLITL